MTAGMNFLSYFTVESRACFKEKFMTAHFHRKVPSTILSLKFQKNSDDLF